MLSLVASHLDICFIHIWKKTLLVAAVGYFDQANLSFSIYVWIYLLLIPPPYHPPPLGLSVLPLQALAVL